MYWVSMFDDTDDSSDNDPLQLYYSESDYVSYVRGNFSACSYLHAKAFDTRQEAESVAALYGRDCYVVAASDSEVASGRRHQLRLRGADLFKLPWNTPMTVMADQYEEAGMQEEAATLRQR